MIKNVTIKKWCIACKNCESICPSIFKVDGKSTVINANYKENIAKILKARDMCPVQVIDVELEAWAKEINLDKTWKIKSINYLTYDVIELKVEAKDFEFIPWQFVWLKLKDKNWKFVRSYSISDWNKDEFTLTIKLLKDWRWWVALKKIKVWDKINYIEASWEFTLKNTKNKKIFISTWTWLAPTIAMLKATSDDVEKVVIFWVRNENDIYYKDLLSTFKNTKVIITVSKPWENYTWNIWRVNNYLQEIKKDDEIYICWNPDMVESVKSDLEKNGIPKSNIFYESFVISKAIPKLGFYENYIVEWNLKYLNVLQWIFIILWLISPVLLYFYPTSFYDISWDIAWWSVFFVIIIRPIADLLPNLMIFRRILIFRKWLWILSWMIILSHFWLNINNAYINFWTTIWEYFSNYFTLKKWTWMNLAARLSEVTALILVITSNNFSQKILWTYWKKIQKLAYVYFISGWIYIYNFWKNEALYCMIIATFLYFSALVYKYIKNKN